MLNAQQTIVDACQQMRIFHHASDAIVKQAKTLLQDVMLQVREAVQAAVNTTVAATLDAFVQPVLDAINHVRDARAEKCGQYLRLLRCLSGR